MEELNASMTVGDLVIQYPHAADMLEQLGIDFCCGGKQPWDAACAAKGLDATTLLQAIKASRPAQSPTQTVDCSTMTMTQLADHIEQTHHAFLKEQLPKVGSMVTKIAEVHGPNHGELRELAQVYLGLDAELSQHMAKEEQILFPFVRELEKADSQPSFHCGSIANPIRVMEMEHDKAGQALARLRQLSGDYTTPEDGCATYRATMDGLKELELDLHQHIHKENNILFPRAVEAEKKLGGGTTGPDASTA